MDSTDRIAHRLKLRDLRLLDTVVRSRSMARAAVQLHLTQPAVSKAISELERMLGAKLLDRSRAGIEPTPHGRALLRRGAAMFDELRQGVSELASLSDPTAGEVRIATSEPIAAGVLPLVIGRLSQRYPRLSIYVTQTPIAMLQQRIPQYTDLRDRNVDLVFGPVVARGPDEGLVTEILFDDHLLVAAGARDGLLRRRKLTLADVIDRGWCLPPLDSLVGMRCAEAFRAAGLDVPHRTVTSTSMQLQTGLVTTQNYLTMLPRSFVHFGGPRFAIKALPIRLQVEPRVIGIITLRNRTISSAAQLFVDMVREVAKPLSQARSDSAGMASPRPRRRKLQRA
jgi:DNA-binding transcriptional LysR family regulator